MPTRTGRRPRLQVPAGPLLPEPITKAAFARLLGCAAPRVTEWTSRRVLTPPAVTAGGLIIPTLAVAQLLAAGAVLPRVDAAAPRGDARGVAMTYDQARTASETLRAHSALADLRERNGELVSRALAEGVLFDIQRASRDAWLNWPARITAIVASRLGVDPARLLAELDREVKAQLSAIADPLADWRRRSKDLRGARPE
jgi:hypothetical protein